MENRPLYVAVIGGGPAGIYASDVLAKSGIDAKIDLYEKLPAPYGLVRYGVAPDHPGIKHIIGALYDVLKTGDIRLVGNVEIGKDVTFDQLREHYDAVIIATGADRDRNLTIPGVNLPEFYRASSFVGWYCGHPDFSRTWPLEAREVAVIGVGNVAVDVARILSKHVEDLLVTEIPQNVVDGLKQSSITDVHVFGRRGAAQVKFSPNELRELIRTPDVDVLVYREDFVHDETVDVTQESKQTRQVVKMLEDHLELVEKAVAEDSLKASRRIHLHMMQAPVAVLGEEHVEGIRMERQRFIGDGRVEGTGETIDYPVQAVYSAVGYFGSPVPGAPFDPNSGVVPNAEGRVIGDDGAPVSGMYATGWAKRGAVGLIGSTKSDARETIAHLVEDAENGELHATTDALGWDATRELLESLGVRYTTWEGWELLEEYEKALGVPEGRERIKVVDRETMTAVSRGELVK